VGFWDDLTDTASGAVSDAITNSQGTIADYLQNRVIAPLVKQGPAPTGNLTAAQIAAGQTGSTPPLAPPASATSMMGKLGVSMPILLVAVGLGAFLLFKGKK
jgi:hypothetical protein